jgi:hypothetical protein
LSFPGIFGLIFVVVFLIVMISMGVSRRKELLSDLRFIPAFQRLRRAIGLSVEDGTRLHFSLGRGSLNGPESTVTFAGLSMLQRVLRIIAVSDRLPVVSSGDGAANILAQDTLRSTYRELGEESQYDPQAGRLTGPTPFSFAAGCIPIIQDEQVSANVLVGHFGSEGAFLAEAGDRSNGMTLAGTDNLTGQAVLFASVDEPLVGEEVFVGAAYLQPDSVQTASLYAQDIFRWVIILLLVFGAVLKLLGLEEIVLALLLGGL